jgi:hypothetical protein
LPNGGTTSFGNREPIAPMGTIAPTLTRRRCVNLQSSMYHSASVTWIPSYVVSFPRTSSGLPGSCSSASSHASIAKSAS